MERRWRLLLTLLLTLCVLPYLANSQESCQTLTDSFTCRQFIPPGTSIYVPGYPVDLAFLETFANRLANLLNFVGIPEPCRSYALQMICITWLRPCQTFPNGTAFPVPQQPCQYMCDNYAYWCEAGEVASGEPFGLALYFPYPYTAPLNCSDPPLDMLVGNLPFYWPNVTLYDYMGTNYTLPCQPTTPVPPPATLYCEPPAIATTNGQGVPQCALGCPLPSLTEHEYDAAKVMQGVIGWLSWTGSTILIFAMLLFPKTRDFPRNLILMSACAANVAAGAIILPTMAGYDNTWCGGSDTSVSPELTRTTYDSMTGIPDFTFNFDESVLSFESGLCTFQGALLQFGFLAAVFWWVVVAFNMCLELYFRKLLNLEKTKWKWIRFIVYNIVVWGLAFLLMVIPASAGRIKFTSAATYCFVTTEDNYAWILTFWFIPVGLALLLGVIMFILALIKITILLITIRKVKTLIFLYLRLSIFIFLYLFLVAFIFSYNIQIANDQDAINQGYEDYYKCLIYATTSCSLSDSVSNYNLVMLKGFAISSLGMFLFFIFISWDLIYFYFQLVKTLGLIILRRKPANIQTLFKMVAYADTTTMTSLTASGSLSVRTDAAEELSEIEDEEEDEEEERRRERRREKSIRKLKEIREKEEREKKNEKESESERDGSSSTSSSEESN